MRCPSCGGPNGSRNGECARCCREAAEVRAGRNPRCPVCDARDCTDDHHAEVPADDYQARMAEQNAEERAGRTSLADDLRSLSETLGRVEALARELRYTEIADWAANTAFPIEDYLRSVGPRGGSRNPRTK